MAPAGSSITEAATGAHRCRWTEQLAAEFLAAADAEIQIVNRDVDQPHRRESHIFALCVADARDGLRVAGRVHAEIVVIAHFYGRRGPTRHGLVEIAQSGRVGYGEVDPTDLSRHVVHSIARPGLLADSQPDGDPDDAEEGRRAAENGPLHGIGHVAELDHEGWELGGRGRGRGLEWDWIRRRREGGERQRRWAYRGRRRHVSGRAFGHRSEE